MKKFLSLLFCCQLLANINCVVTLTFNSLTPIEPLEMKGSGGNLGYSVKSAGDVDKDGYEDIIIGAYYMGAAYVVYGGKDIGGLDVSSHTLIPTIDGFTIKGSGADYLGWSVSGAGDIDNDGYDDIIIGANQKNNKQGAAYVIYGRERSTMTDFDFSSDILDPLTTGFMITGSASNNFLGSSVSSAGDVNKDGFDDIIIGARGQNSNAGAAYVIYGGSRSSMSNYGFSTQTLTPSTTGFMITGVAGASLGGSVSHACDINKDGYGDIIIGAASKSSNKGAAYVIYGGEKANMPNIDFLTDTLDPLTTGFLVTGSTGNDYLGYSVSCAGDINKDEYDDIIIGAYGKNNKQGAAYVIYGGDQSSMSNIDFSSDTLDPLTTGFMLTMLTPATTDTWFGDSVSSAGDINKDGYDDVIIGASQTSSGKGAVYVIYGGPKSSMSNIDILTQTTLDNADTGFSILGTGGRFGGSVSATDVNNDGFSDLLIGTLTQNKAYLLIFYKCSDNCDQCPSITECDACSEGYGVNSLKECQTCAPENCFICSTDYTSCDGCETPYLVYSGQCIEDCLIGTFPDNGKCENCPTECFECTSLSSCQSCNAGYEPLGSSCGKIPVVESPKTEEKVDEIEEKGSEKAVAGAFEGVSIVGAALGSGSSLPLNFGLVAKILRNIKYMKLPVSRELYETFYSWKVASGFLSAPGSWSEKYSSKTIPVVFSRYKLQSAFLINFWKPLMMTIIGIAIFGIFKLIEGNMGNNKKSTVYTISKQVNVAASNFALTQFYSNLDDVLFYFILEMRSTKFETGFRVCSSLLAIVLFLVGAVFMVMHSQILGRYQKLKEASSTPQLEDFVSRFANVSLIFKDFKDTNSLTQSFLMINVGRSVISSLLFATLFEYPMIQISFLIVLNILMIVYLWNLKSFQEFTNTCSQMFCEVILFIANICVFLLALFDHANSYPVTSIERLGKCIIVLNLILLVGCALLMLVNVGKMLYKIYQNKKKSPQQGLQVKKLVSTRPTDLAQAHQNFSTETAFESEKSQQNFEMSQYQNPEESYGNLDKDPSLRYQQEISKNYSIHHPSRNQNPASFAAHIESSEMSNSNIILQSSQIKYFEETSQPNISSKNTLPRSRLMRNREITKARIAQFSKRENNPNYGTPGSGIQDLSFHSRIHLSQDSSIIQDVSLTNLD